MIRCAQLQLARTAPHRRRSYTAQGRDVSREYRTGRLARASGALPYGAALIGRILAWFYLVSASAILTHSSTAMGKRYRKMRTIIAELVRTIQPPDPLERAHVAATLAWINSGAPI